MKNMTYYVVEVAFKDVNPIHRAVCFHRSGGNVELFGSYGHIEYDNAKRLPHFEVVEELVSMSADYPNKWKTPAHLQYKSRKVTE